MMYYRPAEAAKIVGVPISTLNYWEKAFTMFRPARSPKGTRRYTADDIAMAVIIKKLLYRKGYRIAAADEYLRLTYRKYPTRNPRKCRDKETAIRLLHEVTVAVDDAHIIARLDAVVDWLNTAEVAPPFLEKGNAKFAFSAAKTGTNLSYETRDPKTLFNEC